MRGGLLEHLPGESGFADAHFPASRSALPVPRMASREHGRCARSIESGLGHDDEATQLMGHVRTEVIKVKKATCSPPEPSVGSCHRAVVGLPVHAP